LPTTATKLRKMNLLWRSG